MQFDRDIFISYTHVDNKSLVEGQDGWISTFHRGLEIRLEQLRGTPIDIWRDIKLQGNDALDESIFKQFPNLALLVSVLSPRYIQSDWCTRELACFLEAAEARGGVNICGTTRVFKVVKTFLEAERHPKGLQDLLGYQFFDVDAAGRPREFNKVYGPEAERKFWAKLEDLAYDIHQTLRVLEALPDGDAAVVLPDSFSLTGESTQVGTPEGKVIYLAETTPDLSTEREKIRRELEQAGHRVLPDQPLPNPPAFESTVCNHLAQSALSVHLFMPYPPSQTASPAQTQEQIFQQLAKARTRDQIDLANQCCQERPDFSRILWMPADAAHREFDEFVQGLQNEPDFVSTNLESLKDIIRDHLAKPPPATATSLDGIVNVYLDCDERDLETAAIEPLYDWLEQNFHVILPDYQDSSLIQSEALIKQCEAVLIYYGEASGLWLKRRLLALKKTLYGRPKPLRAKAIYAVNPAKQRFSDPKVPVIDGFGGFQPDLLNVFLEQLA
ncbi:MAG: hypothetical protein ACFCVB_05655 [Nodosilinea sp.]